MNKEIRQSYSILKKIYSEQSFASVELNKILMQEYNNSNTKLVTKIVYGVLEKDILLDYIICDFVKKSPDSDIKLILKIGTYIAYFINSITNYACVNELVEITKSVSNRYNAGFVNATLKNIYNNKLELPIAISDPIKFLSINYSYPEWLVKQLLNEHSYDFVKDLLATNLTTLTHIRVLTDKINIKDFIKILDNNNIEHQKSSAENMMYVEYSGLLKLKNLSNMYIVQGLPSIITALNTADNSKLILDLCASPGGKSVLMAQNNPNALVTSCDVSETRIGLIKKYAESYNIKNLKIELNDGTKYREDWFEKFDTVLCDVPCSNLGIASKKPDVLLTRTSESVSELFNIQSLILENAAKYVKKGGVLIYSTCSIMKNENEKVVGTFLKNNKAYKIIPVNTLGVQVTKYHELCTFYPNISNCEGFFIARMVKI